MEKILLGGLIVFSVCLARAETLTATITEQTKMVMTGTKSSVVLKVGTVVEVMSKDGDVLGVIYRKIPGSIPAAKTNFKGEAPPANPSPVAKTETNAKSNDQSPGAALVKTAEATPMETKPAAVVPREDPKTNYGKMVKMARDNEAKHKENLVDPVDSAIPSK
jgi:hypothetical protein